MDHGDGTWRHRKSLDVRWDAHFLTFSCFQRQPFFAGQLAGKWFLDNLVLIKEKCPFDLWGYVLMPEHVHLLILPHDDVTIRSILSKLKTPVTRQAIRWTKLNAPEFLRRMEDRQPGGRVTRRFWQRGGGYDRNMRSTRDIHEKLAYIHDNPLRRGLVDNPEEYTLSSARAWQSGIDDPIPIDRESFPTLVT